MGIQKGTGESKCYGFGWGMDELLEPVASVWNIAATIIGSGRVCY